MAKKTIKKEEEEVEKEVSQKAPKSNIPETNEEPAKADPPEDNTEPTPKEETRETLCPPWLTYRNEVSVLFDQDPEVSVSRLKPGNDDNEFIMTISSRNISKIRAISMLIPAKISFGNVTLTTNFNIIDNCATVSDIYRSAFAGNPALQDIIENVPSGKAKFIYLLFQNKVVHFWNDNLGDPYGNVSTLYQNIAASVCKKYENVYFCTEPDPPDEPIPTDESGNSCK